MIKTSRRRLLCVALCLAAVLSALCGCAKQPDPKTALTGTEFTEKMQALGFTVEDTTEMNASNPGVVQVLTATGETVTLQFYVMDTDESAADLYGTLTALLGQTGNGSDEEVVGPNFTAFTVVTTIDLASVFSTVTRSDYYRIVRVDGTLLYARASVSGRDEVERAAEAAGY